MAPASAPPTSSDRDTAEPGSVGFEPPGVRVSSRWQGTGDRLRRAGERLQTASAPVGDRLHRVSRRAWVLIAVAVVIVASAAAYLLSGPPTPDPLTRRDVDAVVQERITEKAQEQTAAPADATVAHAVIQPSLVLITTTSKSASDAAQRGSGAGVIIKADGTILTSLHVVDGATSIRVSYSDGTTSPATIAARQPANDIATLTPQKLPETVVPAVLGGRVEVGAPVFAVGHPLGLADSLSAGVVSALDRTITADGGQKLEKLIQIDAAVNPGNSGGPLLNKAGQVVGIVTALANPSDQKLFVGIGFAVPIAVAGGAGGAPPQ